MPSQEEYLDNLLKEMTDGHAPGKDSAGDMHPEEDAGESVMRVFDLYASDEQDSDYDAEEDTIWGKGRIQVEDTAHMSAEEIEKLITEAEASEGESAAGLAESRELMDILEESKDTDLHGIHDLLDRAENNVAIDEEIFARAEEEVKVFDPYADEGEEDEPQLTEKERKAQEKKRLKEEKRALKLARIEAEKAAKANKNAEQKAAKKAAKEQEKAKKAEEKNRKAKKKTEKIKKRMQDEPADDITTKVPESEKEVENLTDPLQDTKMDDQDITELFDDMESILNADAQVTPEEDDKNIPDKEPEEVPALEQGEDEFPTLETLDDIPEKSEDVKGESQEDEELMELLRLTGAMDMVDALQGDKEKSAEGMEEYSIPEKDENKEKKPKKGLFSRLIDFLTEEEEEEPEEKKQLQLSDENQGILDALDEELPEKGKRGKKDKKASKEKKAPKKEKKEKKTKPKKEKKPKMVAADEETGGSVLNKKKVMPVLLACASLGVVLVLLVNLVGDFSVKKAGREAYYAGDYETAFENLYGKKLNDSEQIIYGKSESILRIRLWLSEYQLLNEEGDEMMALDSLVQSVNDYPKLYDYATSWNAGSEVGQYYQQILNILSEKYHLTESQAQEIAAERDDVVYTKMIHVIVTGGTFGSWDESLEQNNFPEEDQTELLPDALPEEEGLGEIPLVDNL